MSIEDAALRRLSSRSRTVWELRKYLMEKGYEAAEIEPLIQEYCGCGYLNDAKYCEEYFNFAFGKGKGKNRVFRELSQKGIDQSVIQRAFEAYEPEMDEKARAVVEGMKVLRLADLPEDEPIPEKVIGRIARKLASYGYSTDIVYGALREIREKR